MQTCSAALSQPLTLGKEFRILPAGKFRAIDGRPGLNADWVLTEEAGRKMVAEAAARNEDYLIDYDHQSLLTGANGQPAKAAGWFRELTWKPDGLYITNPTWNLAARAMIEAKEYRFVSPVFRHTAAFEVLSLVSVAITNTPALPALTDLSKIALTMQTALIGDIGMSEAELVSMAHSLDMDVAVLRSGIIAGRSKQETKGINGMSGSDLQKLAFLQGHDVEALRANILADEAETKKKNSAGFTGKSLEVFNAVFPELAR